MVNEFDSNKLIDTISFMCSKKNISANKMLLECNLNKSVLDNLKKGSIPSVDKIMKIADYFKISVDYLLGRTNEPNISGNYINGDNSVQAIRNGNGNMTINTGNKSEKENNCKEIEVLLEKMPRSKQLRAIADIIDLLEEKYQEE